MNGIWGASAVKKKKSIGAVNSGLCLIGFSQVYCLA